MCLLTKSNDLHCHKPTNYPQLLNLLLLTITIIVIIIIINTSILPTSSNYIWSSCS